MGMLSGTISFSGGALRRSLWWWLPALVLWSAACGGREEPPAADASASETHAEPAAAPAEGEELYEVATEVGMRNARMPLPDLITGGQVTPQQWEALKEAGVRRFISLRPADEEGAGWEEEVAGDEVDFVRIPVRGAAGLTRENVEALDRVLDASAGEPTVLYCASGNRVGALLALRAAWLDGADPEAALALGRAAGLRSLEPRVRELLEAR